MHPTTYLLAFLMCIFSLYTSLHLGFLCFLSLNTISSMVITFFSYPCSCFKSFFGLLFLLPFYVCIRAISILHIVLFLGQISRIDLPQVFNLLVSLLFLLFDFSQKTHFHTPYYTYILVFIHDSHPYFSTILPAILLNTSILVFHSTTLFP